MNLWIEALIISFIATVILESAAAYKMGMRKRKNYLLLFLINMLTNPLTVLLYLLMSVYTEIASAVIQIVLEICVVSAEGMIFRRCISQMENNPWIFSLKINLFSYLTGVIVQLAVKNF